MEQRDVSCGAEPGSSGGASGGPGDEKDKDMDSSHRVIEPEDKEYPEADTLTHSSAEADDLSHSAVCTSSEEDSYSDESGMEGEQSDSESEGATSTPQTSPRGAKERGRKRKNTIDRISYSDLSYLNSLPRQKKRRIEGEIIKGRKLALTVNNIVQELRGVDLFNISGIYDPPQNILGIPFAQLAELQSAHHSTDEQKAAVVRYWLLRDPLASWRRIIHQLDEWADYGYDHYNDIADRIRHYAEELTDTTLTHSNLSTVLNHVVDMDRLMDCLYIPDSVQEKIREHSEDEEQQRHECIHYYLKFSPFALWGWGYLGGELHYNRQEAALTAAKAYIQRAPEPSLTLDTLTSVLDGVQRLDGIRKWLLIPHSKREELQRQYDRRQLPRVYSTIFLTDNLSPSWSSVAFALWKAGEHGALEVVQKLYLKDINLQNLCLEKLSNWLKSTSDIDTLPLPTKLKVQLKHRLFGE